MTATRPEELLIVLGEGLFRRIAHTAHHAHRANSAHTLQVCAEPDCRAAVALLDPLDRLRADLGAGPVRDGGPWAGPSARAWATRIGLGDGLTWFRSWRESALQRPRVLEVPVRVRSRGPFGAGPVVAWAVDRGAMVRVGPLEAWAWAGTRPAAVLWFGPIRVGLERGRLTLERDRPNGNPSTPRSTVDLTPARPATDEATRFATRAAGGDVFPPAVRGASGPRPDPSRASRLEETRPTTGNRRPSSAAPTPPGARP